MLFGTLKTDPNFRGDAWRIKPNASEPELGSVVLFKNHVALVVGFVGDHLVLVESNFDEDERIDVGRTVPRDLPSIRGYYVFNRGHLALGQTQNPQVE